MSNSSIRQMPLSAKTRAPASNVHSRDTGFRCTYAVRPTADAPWPVANTTRGPVFSTYLRNCDFAVPGSPHSSTLISPRTLCLPPVNEWILSGSKKQEILHSWNTIIFLMEVWSIHHDFFIIIHPLYSNYGDDCLMAPGLSKEYYWHVMSCMNLLISMLAITRSDIKTQVKWVVSLVIADGYFNIPHWFMQVCMV